MNMKHLRVPNTPIEFRWSKQYGWETTTDSGYNWYFTNRSESEIRNMYPNVIDVTNEDPEFDIEQDEREIYGETLDDEIPDDLWDMINFQ